MFADELAVFPGHYSGHLLLSFSAILTGLAVSVPFGILAARHDRLAGPALGFASVVQTIPGLALLALMVPVMGGRIGFWPAYVALALYSVLPILRNTIVGLRGVDDDLREAALGVGMTEGERLTRIDLPLAAPVIVAGLRTASVWVVGATVLSTPVGAESLGNYIFQGLQTRTWSAVIFGCLVSAGLALALDQVIRLFEAAAAQHSRGLAVGGLVGLAMIAAPTASQLAGAGDRAGTAPASIAGVESLDGRTITLGTKAFTEQYILAEVIARRLEAKGARVKIRDGLGSAVAFDALAQDRIDLYVGYTGTVWANVMDRTDTVPRALMYAEVSAYLWQQHGVLAFGQLGFENAYAFAVMPETAERLGEPSIGALAGMALSIASDLEFFGRPEWTSTRDAYALGDMRTRTMDSTFMYQAVRDGEVDVITANTTDGRIEAYGLELLEDPAGALPPYDAFILLAPGRARDRALHEALAPLTGAIGSAMMRRANARVDLERDSVEAAAAQLLDELER